MNGLLLSSYLLMAAASAVLVAWRHAVEWNERNK